eukprot:8925765-Lingulodinium_polyedra.AAC.1
MAALRRRRASMAAAMSSPVPRGPRSAKSRRTANNGCGGTCPATASEASRNSTSARSSCSVRRVTSAWACASFVLA